MLLLTSEVPWLACFVWTIPRPESCRCSIASTAPCLLPQFRNVRWRLREEMSRSFPGISVRKQQCYVTVIRWFHLLFFVLSLWLHCTRMHIIPRPPKHSYGCALRHYLNSASLLGWLTRILSQNSGATQWLEHLMGPRFWILVGSPPTDFQ